MKIRLSLITMAALILLTGITGSVGADESSTRPLWHKLGPGGYGCGFKSLWQFDYGRTYNMIFSDKALYAEGKSPRPILINLWYPIKSKTSRSAMPYGDYLRISTEKGSITRFSAELAAYARRVVAEEVLFKEEATFSPVEKAAFQTLMDTRTAAYRDAPVARGRFPLVIYHAGYGSSFEDSSVLCEYLASHGYVVVGSAFQAVDGNSFNIEGKVRTAGDIRFLLTFAHSLPYVDWSHVGMVGHSGGAHAAIIYQTEPGCAVDATVSLDTTEDYYSLADPRWNYMTGPVKEAIAKLTRPILFMAKPNAGFEMVDTMTSTPRYLYTVDALQHDDFITHGSLAREIKRQLASDKERDAADSEANLIWNRYEGVCQTVLHFFDATLKGQTAALDAQIARDQNQPVRGDQPHLEYVPIGADGPKPYAGTGESSPSPRQVRQLLRTRGVGATITSLREGWRSDTLDPAYDGLFAFALIYQLVAQGKTEDAVAMFQFWRDIKQLSAKVFLDMGKFYKRPGSNQEFTRTCFACVLAIDPDNTEAVQELKSLGNPISGPNQ